MKKNIKASATNHGGKDLGLSIKDLVSNGALENARSLTHCSIRELAGALQDKTDTHMDRLESLSHALVMATITNKESIKKELLIDMTDAAIELDAVLFLIKAQAPKYGELIEVLLQKAE